MQRFSYMRFHIGNVIEKIRSEKGLTQAQLAASAKIRPNTLGDLENRKKNSRLETLERVAAALGFSVGELYCILDTELRNKYLKSGSTKTSGYGGGNPEHEKYHKIIEAALQTKDERLYRIVTRLLSVFDDIASSATTGEQEKDLEPSIEIGRGRTRTKDGWRG